MSYNGSGVFQINSSGQPVITGTVISSTAFNALTADLATGLSTAITKDGQTTTTARVPFAAGINSTLTTDATSATTGSIITAGGISCQKQAVVGTNLGVGSAPLSPLANRADVTINGASAGAILTLGNAGTRVGYLLTDGTNVSLASETATGYVRFLTNSTERMQITSAGLVGIGCTPTNTLDVSRTTVGTYFTGNGGDNSARALAFTSSTTTNSGDTHTINAKSGTGIIAFAISGTEAARIDASGNLLVGTTTTGGWTTVAKLEVVAGTGNQALSGYNSGSSGNALVLRTDNDNSNLINFNRNGVAAGTFVSTGGGTPNIQWLANNQAYVIAGGSGGVTLASAATAWAAVSDETLKTDLAPIQSGAEKVGSLRAVTGRYKTDAESMSRSFLIAQDVQKVLPEAVSTDADGTLSLRYTEVIPLMVAAIQELTTRLAALENK